MSNTEEFKISELMNFHPKQQEAHEKVKDYKYILYGGAMGGGKSYWLRWECIYFLLKVAQEGHRNVIVGLFCEDYPALKDRHLSKFAQTIPQWLGTMHTDHKEHGRCFILKPEYGSGVLAFRNLDDPSKYQSAEFALEAIDEMTKNPKETFEDLITRLRWPGIKDTKFIAGTNPGGVGHAWVKKWWMDKDFEDEMQAEAHKFAYIQALAKDNPNLGQEYYSVLNSLPEDKKKAFRDGDWDIFKGQYFSEFRRSLHVIKPMELPKYWNRYIWFDYGYHAESAVYWVAINDNDVIYVYRELYEKQLTYSQLMKKIISMTPEWEWSSIHHMVGCHRIFARQGEADMSGADIMSQTFREEMKNNPYKKGIIILKGEQSPNTRVAGWSAIREKLKPVLIQGIKTAKLQIFETCNDLIRTLPALVYDEHRIEDVSKDSEDHGPEAIRIGIMTRPGKTPKNIDPLTRLLNLEPTNQNSTQNNVVIDLE